jgi:GAF domain-containing protein
MLKESESIGVIMIYSTEARQFTDKQIELVKNFAAQAVIAIENARLLTELRTRTDDLGRSVGELRALGEVSQAVNSTLDLQTVLETIVAKAVQLSSTDAGAIYVFDDAQQDFHLRATYGMDQDVIAALREARLDAGDRNVATILAEREAVQSADLSQGEITGVDRIIVGAGYRARLTAPLIRGDDIVGMLVVRRRTPGSFPQNTVDLIKTFAAQSAVAIQNARLFENVETRTRELARSLQDLRTAQDRLIQTEKLASLGQLTAGIAHEIKNPLNFVNNFSSLSAELIDELQETLAAVTVDDKTREEITELADTLRDNLGKVVQHGKRADSIVKNMLLHSRQGSGEHLPVDVNALVEESLNLRRAGGEARLQHHAGTVIRPCSRQCRPVSAGDHPRAAQSHIQRILRSNPAQGGDEWRLRTDAVRRDQGSWRQGRNQDPRQRHRHPSRGQGENVQSVLHHQAGGRGDRPWAVIEPRHHRQATCRVHRGGHAAG